jgi:hypothetical protein
VKIFLDCRMLLMSGIGRYIRNIITKLADCQENPTLTLAGNPNELDNFLKSKKIHEKSITIKTASFNSSIYSFMEAS